MHRGTRVVGRRERVWAPNRELLIGVSQAEVEANYTTTMHHSANYMQHSIHAFVAAT